MIICNYIRYQAEVEILICKVQIKFKGNMKQKFGFQKKEEKSHISREVIPHFT